MENTEINLKKQPDIDDGVIPVTRVRRIIKQNTDIKNISQDSVQVLSKAGELFMNQLIEKSIPNMYVHKNRRTLMYSDIAKAVEDEKLDYLYNIVPPKIMVQDIATKYAAKQKN